MKNEQIQGLDVNGTKPTVAVPNQLSDLNDGNTVVAKTNNANKVYATDDSGNQTTLPYSQGISDGASIVQRDADGRITAQDPASNTDVANKLYVDTLFDGSQKALAYADYSTMITAFNDFSESAYKVGQNVYIRTLNVPDLWIYSVEDTYSAYTYVDDATFIAGLTTDGYVQVGYYKLAQLETQNANISNVKAGDIDSESATNGQVLTANGSGGASWQNASSPHLYQHRIQIATNMDIVLYTNNSTAFTTSTLAQYMTDNSITRIDNVNRHIETYQSPKNQIGIYEYIYVATGPTLKARTTKIIYTIDGTDIVITSSGSNTNVSITDNVIQVF